MLDDVSWRCAAARCSASPDWSAPGAPRWRAPCSAPTAFDPGRVLIDGAAVNIRSPRDAIRHGIGLVPEDRKQQALFLSLGRARESQHGRARAGQSLALFRDEEAEGALIEGVREVLNIRMASPEQIVANLSGGNQQKVVLARWLALRPKVLIVDEPTRGIDVGAKVEVHNLLRDGGRGHRHHRDIVGAARNPGDKRAHRRDAGRAHDRRGQPQRGQRGGFMGMMALRASARRGAWGANMSDIKRSQTQAKPTASVYSRALRLLCF